MADQRRNLKNKDSQLFKSLTKLFSGPIVNYRQQAQLRYRRRDLNKFDFNSASGKHFQKSAYNPFEAIQANIMANQTRAERYADFDQMEYTPEIASALDLYADEMTTHSEIDKMLTINSSNQEIKSILETLYTDVLNVQFNLFGWCRTMCKFGDMFLYLDIDPELGVKSAIGLPSPEIERLEGQDKTNPNYVQYQWNSGGLTFEKWQIAHFRILGQDKYSPYGTSVLEPARRIWRQLNLLEDAMMAYRIVRAPDRRIFYIDVGNIAPDDVEQFMLRIQNQMKRNMIVDPTTGRVDLRYNPMSIDEDYYIPVRGQSATKVDTLSGGNFVGDIDDVRYLRDKLFSALKIPQSYLARDEKASEDKTTLAQKDVRFANEDLLNFKLSLNNPSKISELQELEHWKTKFDVATAASEGYFSKRWIAERIFKLSEQDWKRMRREIYHDKQFEKTLEGAGQEAPAGGGGGGGDLGLPSPETAPEGGSAASPDTGAPAGSEAPEAGGPVDVDNLDRRDAKGRSHSMRSTAIPEAGLGATSRTMFPGYDNLVQLSKLSENLERDDNEIKLHEVNSEVKNLLNSLENMDAKFRKAKI